MGVCGGRVWDEGAGVFDLCFTQQVLGTWAMDDRLNESGRGVRWGWPYRVKFMTYAPRPTYLPTHGPAVPPPTPRPIHKHKRTGALPVALLLLSAPVLYGRRLRPKRVRRGAYLCVCTCARACVGGGLGWFELIDLVVVWWDARWVGVCVSRFEAPTDTHHTYTPCSRTHKTHTPTRQTGYAHLHAHSHITRTHPYTYTRQQTPDRLCLRRPGRGAAGAVPAGGAGAAGAGGHARRAGGGGCTCVRVLIFVFGFLIPR